MSKLKTVAYSSECDGKERVTNLVEMLDAVPFVVTAEIATFRYTHENNFEAMAARQRRLAQTMVEAAVEHDTRDAPAKASEGFVVFVVTHPDWLVEQKPDDVAIYHDGQLAALTDYDEYDYWQDEIWPGEFSGLMGGTWVDGSPSDVEWVRRLQCELGEVKADDD